MSGLSLSAAALAAVIAFTPAGTAGPEPADAPVVRVAVPEPGRTAQRRDMQAEAEAALADPERRERVMAALAGALIYSVKDAPAGLR